MEQVAANHGDGIREIRASCVKDLAKGPRDIEPPTSFQEFYDFPGRCGWEVREDFTYGASKTPGKQKTLPFFIQSWLFFGLIFTVVQIDKKPVLSFEALLNGEVLSTKDLHQAINRWTEWEANHQEGLRFRLIQVGWVLDLARHFIQKNFAYDYASDTDGDGVDDDDIESLNGDQSSCPQVSDKSMLVLMCLGETLSAAKARIVEKNQVDTTGWHGDDNVGWGPPRYVFEQMRKQGWCPRAVAILRGQVSSNATMLVAAYQAYQKSPRMNQEHIETGCTRQECKVKSIDERGNYQNRHTENCKGKKRCKPCGPQEDEVIEVLRNGGIPLLEICDNKKEKEFKVIPFHPKGDSPIKFVAISHVWSDGWGNEEENKLNICQVDFILRQIKRVTGRPDVPFWMDTLVVPVAKHRAEYRKKAIRQIFDVFNSSRYTIILDNGLSGMDRGGPDKPAEAAMKIFSSMWMRRLWTLQEAYLSRNIYIPFEEDGQDANNVLSFDDLEDDLLESMAKPTSGITQMIKAQLSRMIMGEERRWVRTSTTTRAVGRSLKENDAMVVANAYRAARWRVTGKAEHEVLALATLLRLDTKETEIEEAGLDAPATAGQSFDIDRLDNLVCVFWDELHKQRKGVIPSGMIFLPGDKVNRRGFGWAPRTWLSAYEMDYPDPLSFWNTPTELNKDKGLRVCYPGFLLHPESYSSRCRSRILGTSVGSDPFTFPVDNSLNEWYTFQRLDDSENGQPNEVTRLEKAKTQLAVILSGSLPRESPREVALLVEVIGKETSETSNETLDQTAVEYHASIIHRVLIWREANYLRDASARLRFKMGYSGDQGDRHVCLGEALGSSQRWWVDRPVDVKTENMQGQMTGDVNVDQNFKPTPLARSTTFKDRVLGLWWWGGGAGGGNGGGSAAPAI